MAQDIDIIRSVVRIVSKFVNTDQFVDLHGVVEELWTSFREETNFGRGQKPQRLLRVP